MNGMLHHRGDLALARAAAATGIPFVSLRWACVTWSRILE
jgi:hypothetical protein